MISDERLIKEGLGAIFVDPEEEDAENLQFEPIVGLSNDVQYLTGREKMLLLAGFSIYKYELAPFYVWIISDDPYNDKWMFQGKPVLEKEIDSYLTTGCLPEEDF